MGVTPEPRRHRVPRRLARYLLGTEARRLRKGSRRRWRPTLRRAPPWCCAVGYGAAPCAWNERCRYSRAMSRWTAARICCSPSRVTVEPPPEGVSRLSKARTYGMPAARTMRSACAGMGPLVSSPKRRHTPTKSSLGTEEPLRRPGSGMPTRRAMAAISSSFDMHTLYRVEPIRAGTSGNTAGYSPRTRRTFRSVVGSHPAPRQIRVPRLGGLAIAYG